ncbi:Ovochymase-1 [Orchesella cincta]|uniref:Ovochymase-1 n=1 Tax=Orchesella cincta TaxID=48709 RepID=A0A1D2MK75_ORCCI|nr:Ovochymase-1 [Orchesella cincta]
MFQKLVLIGAIALVSLALAAKLPNSRPETFIVGGRNATPNEFPWLVRFTVLDAAGDSRFCTGALIALNVVLTSASCVRDNSRPITVVAGDHLLLEEDGTEVSIASQEVTLHEDFNSTSLENDIALIHLSSSFQQNAAIQPVQLPNATDDPEASGYAFIAGWGETSLDAEEEGTLSAILRTAEVIVSTGNFVCEALYGISLPEGQFCTSGSGGAKGDRGAPLICHSTKNVTCGVLSHTWLDISGLRTNVGGWVKVNEYLDWILQHL